MSVGVFSFTTGVASLNGMCVAHQVKSITHEVERRLKKGCLRLRADASRNYQRPDRESCERFWNNNWNQKTSAGYEKQQIFPANGSPITIKKRQRREREKHHALRGAMPMDYKHLKYECDPTSNISSA